MEAENILIAEFMGIDTAFDGRFSINPITKYGGWELMVYHSDWNWLMEVVKKIESLNVVVEIRENVCYIETTPQNYTSELGPTKIQATYKACVEFIKWYNKQNK